MLHPSQHQQYNISKFYFDLHPQKSFLSIHGDTDLVSDGTRFYAPQIDVQISSLILSQLDVKLKPADSSYLYQSRSCAEPNNETMQ